uniref:RUN domain-containing protein n=1 Tax=Macrostomum lignano TaxID=282301 RepID=A0A1I8I309_9PLAT
GAKMSAHGAKMSAYGAKMSAYGAKMSAYGAKMSAYGAKMSAYGAKMSACGAKTAYGAKMSAFGAKSNVFGAIRNACGAKMSADNTILTIMEMLPSLGVDQFQPVQLRLPRGDEHDYPVAGGSIGAAMVSDLWCLGRLCSRRQWSNAETWSLKDSLDTSIATSTVCTNQEQLGLTCNAGGQGAEVAAGESEQHHASREHVVISDDHRECRGPHGEQVEAEEHEDVGEPGLYGQQLDRTDGRLNGWKAGQRAEECRPDAEAVNPALFEGSQHPFTVSVESSDSKDVCSLSSRFLAPPCVVSQRDIEEQSRAFARVHQGHDDGGGADANFDQDHQHNATCGIFAASFFLSFAGRQRLKEDVASQHEHVGQLRPEADVVHKIVPVVRLARDVRVELVIPQSVGLYGDDEDSPPLEFCGSPVSSKPAQTAAPSRLPVPESPTRQLNRLSAQAASAVEQLISICSLPSNGQSSSVIVGLLCRSLYSLVSNGLAMSSAWSTAKFVNQFGGNVSKARTVQQRSLLLKKSRLMASPLCLLVEESCASCVPIGLKLSAIVRQINASKSESNGEQGRFDAFVVACLNAGFLSAWLKHLCSNTDLLKRNYRPLALLRQGTPASLNSLARLCSLLDRLQLMQKQQHRQHANRRRNYWPMPASQTEQRQSSGAVARKFRSTSASRLPRPKSAASLGSRCGIGDHGRVADVIVAAERFQFVCCSLHWSHHLSIVVYANVFVYLGGLVLDVRNVD